MVSSERELPLLASGIVLWMWRLMLRRDPTPHPSTSAPGQGLGLFLTTWLDTRRTATPVGCSFGCLSGSRTSYSSSYFGSYTVALSSGIWTPKWKRYKLSPQSVRPWFTTYKGATLKWSQTLPQLSVMGSFLRTERELPWMLSCAVRGISLICLSWAVMWKAWSWTKGPTC